MISGSIGMIITPIEPVCFDGAEQFIVEEGNCVYFDSGIPHFGESVGKKKLKCFLIPAVDK